MSFLNKPIVVKDTMNVIDTFGTGLRGEVIVGRNSRLEEFTDPYGNTSYRTVFGETLFRERNIVPIGAYQFVFSKLFNIAFDDPLRTNLKVGHLNDNFQQRIGVNPQHYKIWDYNAETNLGRSVDALGGINISANNYIFGFMMGDGGAREDNITAIAPDYKRRALFHPIPFKITENPNDVWNNKYFGRFTDAQGVTSFYIKLYENTSNYPHIVHAWVTESDDLFQPVDESVFSSTSSTPIESYVEMLLKIEPKDGTDYFKRTNTTPRINEIGLVTGWYDQNQRDYNAISLFTHFCRPSLVLGENDWVEIIYRLYSR